MLIQISTTRRSSLAFWIRRKQRITQISILLWVFESGLWPTPSCHLNAFVCPPILPAGYFPFWYYTKVCAVCMSTKLDIHTSFIQARSVVVYFSRVCGLDRRPKWSVKHIVHCIQPHSVCLRKRDTLWINLNLKPLLISVILFTKCITSGSSNVNITLDRSRGIESLLILALCLCGSVLVVIALMP